MGIFSQAGSFLNLQNKINPLTYFVALFHLLSVQQPLFPQIHRTSQLNHQPAAILFTNIAGYTP